MTAPYHAERAAATAAVRAAATLTRSVRDGFDPSQSTAKGDRSPVTVADLGAQVLVSLALAEAFPHDPLVGEEDASQVTTDPAIRAGVERHLRACAPEVPFDRVAAALDRGGATGGPAGRWWTLDPVDGTKGFLRGGQYAIALALVEDGEVVMGVLGCPALERPDGRIGSLFVAVRGEGAWEEALDDTPSPARISVAAISDPAEACYAESVEAAHSGQEEAARIGSILGITAQPSRLDSQAKYALVARGDASIYLRIPRGGYVENIWDHAAGALVVEEAGGVVTDVDGRTLDWTTGRRLTANRGIIAAPAAIHGAVVDAAREVLATR
ncbi:MAG: 3'(2'),5'-bisphosphate nucleotidase [Chloroflexi bacterium]|nr:3'(2'),5'-bisphosphate nucleotidase [Chloroflexota bacterium]